MRWPWEQRLAAPGSLIEMAQLPLLFSFAVGASCALVAAALVLAPQTLCKLLVQRRWVRRGMRVRLQVRPTSFSLLLEAVALHDDAIPWVNSYAAGYVLPVRRRRRRGAPNPQLALVGGEAPRSGARVAAAEPSEPRPRR